MFQTNFVAKVKTPILFSLNFVPKLVLFMMWKNMVQPDRPQMIRRMCFACWITKTTNTQSEYVMFIAFPRRHC